MSKIRIPRGTAGASIDPNRGQQHGEAESHQAQLKKVAAAVVALPAGLTDLEHKVQLLKDERHPGQGVIVNSYTFVTADGECVTFSVAGPPLQFGEPARIVVPSLPVPSTPRRM